MPLNPRRSLPRGLFDNDGAAIGYSKSAISSRRGVIFASPKEA
jgi:hypothetical protein